MRYSPSANGLRAPLVEITGGEPLVQDNARILAECIVARDYVLLVETNGSLPIDGIPSAAIKILDFKCPGSGMADRNDWGNVHRLTPGDEVKFVVGDRADYEWARDAIRRFDLPARCKQVLLSPVHGKLAPGDLVQWMLDDDVNARFQLQLHKYVWPPEARGV